MYSDTPSFRTEVPPDHRAGTPASRPKTVYSSAPRTTTPMSARTGSDRTGVSGKAVTFLDEMFVESRAEILSLEEKRRARLAAEADRRRAAFRTKQRATDQAMLQLRQPFAVARAAGLLQRAPVPKEPSLADDKKAGFVFADERPEPPASAMQDLDRFDFRQQEVEREATGAARRETELAEFALEDSDSD